MKFLCLRSCYVNDQIFLKGETHELPESMESDKHFQLVGEPAPAPAPEKTRPEVIPAGQYWCPRCNTLHREIGTSKIGKKHLKFKVEPESAPEPKPEEGKTKPDEGFGHNE